MTPLSESIARAAAFSQDKADVAAVAQDHYESRTVIGGVSLNVDKFRAGVRYESARLAPLIAALGAVAVAADEERVAQAKYDALLAGDSMSRDQENEAHYAIVAATEASERVDEALARLRDVVGEKT